MSAHRKLCNIKIVVGADGRTAMPSLYTQVNKMNLKKKKKKK